MHTPNLDPWVNHWALTRMEELATPFRSFQEKCSVDQSKGSRAGVWVSYTLMRWEEISGGGYTAYSLLGRSLSVAPRVENIVWQISSNTSSFLQMGSLLIVEEILMSHSLYENSSLADWALCLLKISKGILGFSRSLCWKVGTGGTTRDEIERHEF